jgi:hypothetical protein
MILQTGQRTDIPAFYADWFFNRIREGFVYVRNPYNPRSVTCYSLSPELVDVIGFCSKNPAPMLDRMDLLKDYPMYWHVTITPYGREIEPNVPDREEVLSSFRRLSSLVGVDRIAWRYDPIFLSEVYTVKRHLQDFEEIARELSGFTQVCIISFIDLYEKVKRNFPEAERVPKEERLFLGKEIIRIAQRYGMLVRPCGEGEELSIYGADCRGCMTEEIWEKAAGTRLIFPKRKPNRDSCVCFLSGDIGQYDTCGHFCRYCYANTSRENVLRNRKAHDPASPLLVGQLEAEDQVHEMEQRSWADRQMSIFDFGL